MSFPAVRPLLIVWIFFWALRLGANPPREPLELPLWPGVPPGSEGMTAEEKWEERGKDGVTDRAVRQVHRPTVTAYLPEPGKATGVAVLLAPGGGYEHVTIDKEGHDVARWLREHGVAGFVLKYRLPKTPGANYTGATALADAEQGLKIVRAHAKEWGITPGKIGMMGFSAGGNLAALAGTGLPPELRPAFMGLLYPSIPESFGPVPADAPPAFIAQAADDSMGTEHSLRIYQWLHANKTPVELHLFASGAHGFGLGKRGTPPEAWPELFLRWVKAL